MAVDLVILGFLGLTTEGSGVGVFPMLRNSESSVNGGGVERCAFAGSNAFGFGDLLLL